jgi:cell division septum initiation protein DivIVA
LYYVINVVMFCPKKKCFVHHKVLAAEKAASEVREESMRRAAEMLTKAQEEAESVKGLAEREAETVRGGISERIGGERGGNGKSRKQ